MATTKKQVSKIRENQDKERKAFIKKLRGLSSQESLKVFVQAGVLTATGDFTAQYR
jgi:hypothetical protein